MNRRSFLVSTAAIALGRAALGTQPRPRIGIQLYSLRDDARRDLAGTLAAVAAIGYTEVELLDSMQNFGMAPAPLRALLDRLGLAAPSTHVGPTAFDDLPRLLDAAGALGHRWVVLAGLPEADARTVDGYRRWADRLNAAGATLARGGVRLAFHDEPNDFRRDGDAYFYDALASRTDPALVRLQLDTGNALMGGADPLALLARYRDRYDLFHVKDAAALRAPHDAELGAGVLPLRALLAAIGPLAGKHLYVEQESYPGTPLESARRDFAALGAALAAAHAETR